MTLDLEKSPELHAAIETAKARINVDSYYSKAMNNSLKGNAQGYFGGTVLGLGVGAMAGGLLMALNIGALPVLLGLAALGGTMGGMTGARLGGDAGAVAGVFAEKERREKAEQLEQEILHSPEKQREAIAAYRANPVVEQDDTLKEVFATSRTVSAGWHRLVNLKVMAVSIALCSLASIALFAGPFLLATGGAAVAAAPIASGIGIALQSVTQAVLLGLGTGTAVGVGFGINYPAVFATLAQKTADLLTGKILRGETGAAPVKTVPQVGQEAAQNRAISESVQPNLQLAASEIPAMQVSEAQYGARLIAPSQQVAV